MSIYEITLIDEDALKDMREMMGEKISRMFNFFFEDSVNYFEAVEAGFKDKNLEKVIEASHSLKSSSELIGALRLSAQAKDIEMTSRELVKSAGEDFTLLDDKISDLKEILDATLIKYKEYKLEHNI